MADKKDVKNDAKDVKQQAPMPMSFEVKSNNIAYTDDEITAEYTYHTTRVTKRPNGFQVEPVSPFFPFALPPIVSNSHDLFFVRRLLFLTHSKPSAKFPS